MKRQVGADTIDLDTSKGWARYGLARERKIDFAQVEKAANAAGYTLKGLELETTGTVSRDQGVLVFKIDRTGQVFPIRGFIEDGFHGQIQARVLGSGSASVLEVMAKVPVKPEPTEPAATESTPSPTNER